MESEVTFIEMIGWTGGGTGECNQNTVYGKTYNGHSSMPHTHTHTL